MHMHIALKMWWPSLLLLLYTLVCKYLSRVLLFSFVSCSVQPNGCNKSGSSSGEFDPDDFLTISIYYEVQHMLPILPKEPCTTVSLLNSNFTNNRAQGLNSTLILFSNYYSAVNSISEVVHIYIDRCIFNKNRAFVGSAIIIYERKIYGLDVGMQVSIKNTDFVNNEILTMQS